MEIFYDDDWGNPCGITPKAGDLVCRKEGYPYVDNIQYTLTRACGHFGEIFVSGCSENGHFDSFRCSQSKECSPK